MADFVTAFETGTSRSNFTYEPPTRNTSVVVTVPSHTTYATVGRTERAKTLTLLMFWVNWSLTFCTLCITWIVANSRVDSTIALLPITTILSIPSIRALYIGSPPFGISLGTHRNYTTPIRKLTPPTRPVGVHPTNDNCSGVCHDRLDDCRLARTPDAGRRSSYRRDPRTNNLRNNNPGQGDLEKGNIGKYYAGEKGEV